MMLIHEFTRLLNKFWPGSITQIEPCEDGVLRRSNVTKFLDSCSAKGLPPEDLFLPDDLMEGTSHGLTRVAGTIIALIKWGETSAPTGSHSLPDEDNVNPETPSSLRKRPRIKTGAIDPLLVRSAHVAVGELPFLSTRRSLPGAHRRLISHQIRLALKSPSHLSPRGPPQLQQGLDPRLARKRASLKMEYSQRANLRRP